MTVEEIKAEAKAEKKALAQMIAVYQTGHKYTYEELMGKSLKKLREIYEHEVKGR